MTNEEMFTAIIEHMDAMESRLNSRMDSLESRMDKLESRMDSLESRMDKLESRMDRLESRMDKLESRMDKLESRMDKLESRMDSLESRMDNLETDMDMEFKAVRAEMDVGYKTLKQDIFILNNKADQFIYRRWVYKNENTGGETGKRKSGIERENQAKKAGR